MKKLLKSAKATLGFRLPEGARLSKSGGLLVVIFLRGGVDGLSMLAPYADDGYYRNRVLTSIAPPSSGSSGRLIDLDGFFGLHPSMSALYPIYSRAELCFVHACGSDDRTLSHFAASNTVEMGSLNGYGDSTGWVARYLDALPANSLCPLKAVSIGSLLPASLSGASCALAVQKLSDLAISCKFATGSAGIMKSLRDMYNGRDILSIAARQTIGLVEELKNVDVGSVPPAGNYDDDDLGSALRQVGALVKSRVGLSVACIDQSGYDTHVAQGAAEGALAQCLASLARNISAFTADIGNTLWKSTKIVVMSEFGRRVRENDGGGTDHGHGNAMMIAGGAGVIGGIHGVWPGLAASNLDQNGNLRSTTDYRSVLVECVAGQIGLSSALSLFPDLKYQTIGAVHAA